MSELKSSYEIALENMKKRGVEESQSLTEEQKEQIAGIRREFEAKVAEKQILLRGSEELADEIRKLGQKRDEKIEAVYKRQP